MGKQLELMVAALEEARQSELRALRDKIVRSVMNLPCDVSATGKPYHSAVRVGHKQARYAAIESVNEIFYEALEGGTD